MNALLPVRELKARDPEAQAALEKLLETLLQRRTRNRVRQSYYDSKTAIVDVARVIPPVYQQYAFALGWSAKAVDALARRCALDGFVWPDGELGDLGVAEWLDGGFVLSDLSRAFTASLTLGPAFVVTTPGGEKDPESLVTVRDAMDATGIWDWRRHCLSSALSIDRVTDAGEPSALSLYLSDRTYALQFDQVSGRWDVDRVDHPGMGILAEVLAYRPDFRNPLGRSRITRPIMALQDAALRSMMRLEGHMDVYSFPEYWLLGADESIFKNADGSQQEAWRIRLGRIKGIPDDDDAQNPRADVKQFSGSDPTSHLANLNALAKVFAREASLPDTAVAITDMANPTSAESYDSSQYELIAEAEGAMRDWSAALGRIAARGLTIQNGLREVPAAWRSIAPQWRDPRYTSKAAVADAGMKQLAAVPWLAETSVGLELVGLTSQQIERAESERRRMAGSELLASLLDAPEASADDPAVRNATALAQLVRAGADPDSAAAALGMSGIKFTDRVPVGLTDADQG